MTFKDILSESLEMKSYFKEKLDELTEYYDNISSLIKKFEKTLSAIEGKIKISKNIPQQNKLKYLSQDIRNNISRLNKELEDIKTNIIKYSKYYEDEE